MDHYEKEMFAIVNRNHELRVFADKLSAISAGRKTKKSIFRRKSK